MAFKDELARWPRSRIEDLVAGMTPDDVDRALAREEKTPRDLAALLSAHAVPRLEEMAREAHGLTRRHFGRTMGLYVPLYLSNVCGADCTYCGYAVHSGNGQRRVTLDGEAIHAECRCLAAYGFKHILLLTGEAPRAVPVDYIAEGVRIAREYFPSVSVEIYSLDTEDYGRLRDLGLEGVTIYMETYDRALYEQVHLVGKKRDYDYRLDAVERAGKAGARRLSLGVLLGLTHWQVDGFWLALHAQYIQRACWRSAVSMPSD